MAGSIELEQKLGGTVIGIDEAGRGPLVGGVYAAGVTVPQSELPALLDGPWREVDDSKRLAEKHRDELAELIRTTPGCKWFIASASSQEIDEHNILAATHMAMRRAAQGLAAELDAQDAPVHILVDGLPVDGLPFPSQNVVRGDSMSLLIAAASILAKSTRDADCRRLDRLYPGYGFAKHKGYPTAAHLKALSILGPCPEHRMSFAPVVKAKSAAFRF